MTDRLEDQFRALLDDARLWVSQPERDSADPTNFDFFLPEVGLYVEIKQFHSPRILAQLDKLPEGKNVMVLIGPDAVARFAALVQRLKP